jgi:hypothetical protein
MDDALSATGEFGARFKEMMDRVVAEKIEPVAHLRHVLRTHVGSSVDVPPRGDAVPKNQTGTFNYVVAVPSTSPTIAVRVSVRGTDPFCLADEMARALEAHAAGAGMRPIWFGLVLFGQRDVRAVSCWPWAKPACAHIRGLSPTQRRSFAREVEDVLVALSRACVYVDVKVANMMILHDKTPVVIDFDPYFTKRVDPTSADQRGAARAFVPVAMLLMHCSAGPTASLFDQRDIARAAETDQHAHVSVIAERLGVACDRVCATFPELECVLMSVLQKYVPFCAKRRLTGAGSDYTAVLKEAADGANDSDAIARIAIAGLTGAHVRVFLNLAMGCDADAMATFSQAFTVIAATARFEHMASQN